MKCTYLVLGLLAVGGLGCDVASDDGLDAGTDAAAAGDGDGDGDGDGGMMPPRTGTADSGELPDREPDQTDGDQAGEGDTATDTDQPGDDGDPVWMMEEDVTGDGDPETVTSLFDDETGTFYVWYTLTDGNCVTKVLVIFDGDGMGNQGDGSGRYVIDAGCDDSTDLVGCEFDASGADTTCGVCTLDALEVVWACIAGGGDPNECECDVDFTCSDACLCDVECLEMCECDVDFMCSDGCECDFECVFGECTCDVDSTCSEGCECDFECSEDFCDCDLDDTCVADCACDVDC